jgi:hypothetical protein
MANNVRDIQAVLQSMGETTDMIGRPWIDLQNTDSDISERSARAEQDQRDLATVAPQDNTGSIGTSLLNNPMFLSNLNRVGVTIYAFFAVTIILAIYRYSMRLSAHYDACADALELSDGPIDARFNHLVRSLSPAGVDFGKVPKTPVDHSAEILQSALRSRS